MTNEIKCQSCDGTGVDVTDPNRNETTGAPSCKVCGGKGKVVMEDK